jgi:hypothetical protein
VPLLGNSQDECPALPGRDAGGPDGKAQLWQALRCKCGELSSLVLRADDPGEAAAYVVGYLPKHLEYVFELLFGHKRPAVPGGSAAAPLAARAGEVPLIAPGRSPPRTESHPTP